MARQADVLMLLGRAFNKVTYFQVAAHVVLVRRLRDRTGKTADELLRHSGRGLNIVRCRVQTTSTTGPGTQHSHQAFIAAETLYLFSFVTKLVHMFDQSITW